METKQQNQSTMGFNDLTMETLRDRASTMKDCLARSQTITDSMTSILGSFDLRLSALETAMRPTQVCFVCSVNFRHDSFKKRSQLKNVYLLALAHYFNIYKKIVSL